MKALVLESKGEPFVNKDVQDPVPTDNDAVAKVIACGSGLTIQHVRAGRIKVDYPRIIGHEITAVIEEVGKNVTNVKVGDAVMQGDIIGTVGSTGRSTGPHLDFRINWFQTRLDPMSVIN